MIVTMEPFAYSPMGRFCNLTVEGGFSCYTVERPWLDNQPFKSCIPEGEYEILLGRYHRGDGGRGYDAYELQDVPGRSLIKIHRANNMDQLLGCIAPGTTLGWYKGRWAVLNSTTAFRQFMQAMDGQDGVLRIGQMTGGRRRTDSPD